MPTTKLTCAGKKIRDAFPEAQVKLISELLPNSRALANVISHHGSKVRISQRGHVDPDMDRVGCGQDMSETIRNLEKEAIKNKVEAGEPIQYKCPKCGNEGLTMVPYPGDYRTELEKEI